MSWIAGNGNWDQDSNWSTGSVPGEFDTAVINTASPATITIRTGDDIHVQAVSTAGNDTLSITGGSLTIQNDIAIASTLDGPLSMTGGTLTATGAGVAFTANGTTTVSKASLYAQAGASLGLPHLTSYVSDGTTFQAEGIDTGTLRGSVPDVSALTTVTQQSSWYVNALTGGAIKLTGLSSLSSTHGISINDSGSSAILDGNLTSLDGVSAYLEGSDAQVANSWTKFINGNLTVTGSHNSVPNLADGTGSNFNVDNGSLSVPATTNGGTYTISSTGILILGSENITTTSLTIPGAFSAGNWAGTFQGTASDSSGSGIASVGISFFDGSHYFNGSAFASNTLVYLPATLSGTDWTFNMPIVNFPIDVACIVGTKVLDHNGGTESSAITSLVLTQMPPVVSSVTPSHGLASGGTTVTITGAYFSHVAAVNFGANNPATIISSTPTTIVVTSPPGAVGAVDVVVSTRQGTSAASTADQFTYLVVPSSTVAALPTYSPASFPVTWSGHVDSTLHIAYYDIYVSDNNGDFAIWQSHTTLTSAIFTGQDSHHYGFYSVATDSAGDVEPRLWRPGKHHCRCRPPHQHRQCASGQHSRDFVHSHLERLRRHWLRHRRLHDLGLGQRRCVFGLVHKHDFDLGHLHGR